MHFHTELEEFLDKQGLGLQELIYGAPLSAASLEKKWCEAFSEKEFAEVGCSKYYPKIVRGLPHLYLKEDTKQSRIKEPFTHLPLLKKLGADRALYSVYEKVPVLGVVGFLTWVMADGWGDLIAGWEAIRILKERFPEVEVRWVVLLPEKRELPKLKGDFTAYWIEKEEWTQEARTALESADCIVQLPTFYPKSGEIRGWTQCPWIEMGEYGFLESDRFNPRSGRVSLGLHSLEKGVFIHKTKERSFAELKNEQLLQLLFATTQPGPLEIEKFLIEQSFYLAYLSTVEGGFVYLQALIRAHEHDEKVLCLVTPDLGWVIGMIREGLLAQLQGVSEIEIYYDGKCHSAKLNTGTKRLRILCPGALEDADFRTLVRLSGEWVAVRGNQSFSEAVSANKVYFYDGPNHAQHFIRDLAALAENRISAHRSALALFRAMRKTFLHHLPQETGEWVEESHFQEREPLLELGLQAGIALQDPDCIAGFKKLNRIIIEQYSANEFLCHAVQRAFCHLASPDVARSEATLVSAFAHGQISFAECFTHLEKKLKIWKIEGMSFKESQDLHNKLGAELRALIDYIAHEEKKIHQLTEAIGGSICEEAAVLKQHIQALSEAALHLEQETRQF